MKALIMLLVKESRAEVNVQHIRKAEVVNKSESVTVLVCTYSEAASVRGLVKLGTPAVTC